MNEIFVFGSNLAGRHGKGAALEAKLNWGAIYGQGAGLQGNSYAIPTKDHALRSLPLTEINKYVKTFIKFAAKHWIVNSDFYFIVTPVGCGLAGYSYYDIAPMFKPVLYLPNVQLPQEFIRNI